MCPEMLALNRVDGGWQPSGAAESLEVFNPATAEDLGRVPLSPAGEVPTPPMPPPGPFPAG